MLNFVIPLTLIVTATPAIEEGTKLVYRGSFVAVKGEPRDTLKTFDLEFVATSARPRGTTLHWTITEQGHGAWPWPHRFGRLDLDASGRVSQGTGPSLAYVNEEGTSLVPLIAPLLAHDQRLTAGLAWERDKLRYEVSDSDARDEAPQWNVNVAGRFGRQRTLAVAKKTSVVSALSETVFINRGQQYDLEYRLVSADRVKPETLPLTVATFEALLRLSRQLKLDTPSTELNWSAEQLEILKRELPSISKLPAASGALMQIAQAAERDARQQESRAGSVADLREKAIGHKMGEFKLTGLSQDQLTQEDLKGAVTVLHFWSYRDKPLKEPYGQVGYLDFLNRQRSATNVKVIGVAVMEGPATEETLTRSKIAARKFRSFMNLSYPVFIDTGGLLAKIGDPRKVEATLPLFVVVDAGGKVLHYHVGFYDIDPARGLVELDGVVMKHLP